METYDDSIIIDIQFIAMCDRKSFVRRLQCSIAPSAMKVNDSEKFVVYFLRYSSEVILSVGFPCTANG